MSATRRAKESPLELLSTRPTVSVTQAAVILSISRGQAYAMAHRGELRALRIGSRLVIPTEQLRQLITGAA
ncbi:MAG: helix-turn-helix domain-containing protein [Propionicimonas sp.]